MTYHGRIENGQVVLNDTIDLPEGTEVEVVVPPHVDAVDQCEEGPTLLESLGDFVGSAKNLPPDASRNIDHYLYGLPKK